MRALVFILAYLPLPFFSLVYPAAGILAWAWLSFANPHREVYGIAFGLQYNLVIALCTIVGAAIAVREFRFRLDATTILTFALALCLTSSLVFSFDPSLSFDKWEERMKTLLFVFMIYGLMNSKIRIIAFVWMIVLALAYFGTKGGLLFVASAGGHQFTGPARSMISDRNNLALALVMVIPLMNYLRIRVALVPLRYVLLLGMGLTALAILGTYSRGGFLALIAMGAFLWWRSRQKIALGLVVALIALPAVTLVPDRWTDRMGTISEAHDQDNSFRGRLLAWAYHTNAALDRPLTGAGPLTLQEGYCFRYMPSEEFLGIAENKCRAAHSIYFEVLGDLGFIGLFVYLCLALVAWRNAARAISLTRGDPERLWLHDLARMVQVSFVGFFIGGAALSMAFYDVYLALTAVAAVMRRLAEEAVSTKPVQPEVRRAPLVPADAR
jgi:putative inorganic carbon (hco3(-)) transporter